MSSRSESMSSFVAEARPQAAPLPQKRGEIGFMEGVHVPVEQPRVPEPAATMPMRHPADDPIPSANNSTSSLPTTGATNTNTNTSSTGDASAANNTAATNGTNTESASMRKPKRRAQIAGISLLTLVRLIFQFLFIGGTVVAWVLIIQRLGNKLSTPIPDPDSNDPNGNDSPSGGISSNTGTIFVHVAFAVAVLAQLLFVERTVFQIRAERYCATHPECMMPGSNRRIPRAHVGMGFAPWNRPSLPTYAAALAQSGHGTGDVEDHLIAVPPPPAYGNTRGSTLLLAGMLPTHLRRNGSTGSVRSNGSRDVRNYRRPQTQTIPESRPVSYMTIDGESSDQREVRQDAHRARMLEESLGRLNAESQNRAS